MFIEVHANRGTVVLTGVGTDEMSLLRRMADGVHVQAFDDSKDYKKVIVLAPKLLDEMARGGRTRT